jgi:hypothetical protein
MTSSTQFYCFFLVLLVALWPQDCLNVSRFTWLWVLTRILNYYLMIQAYMMYRRLRSDFGKMGLPMPAFKFIPIWERNGN